MVDGKICSIMLRLASSCCHICGATPTMMQSVRECVNRVLNPIALEFGISPLHLWMRCADFFLKISYRLKIKKARVSKKSREGALIKEEKKKMQKLFWERLKLKVDYPNPHGGNSNDGNCCRKLF